jgi:acyl-[acyl-carrier-protein]-phospholipid O-acyltransferase / long-chain-fatty-acid--[acyl-carrier-protein] ligase
VPTILPLLAAGARGPATLCDIPVPATLFFALIAFGLAVTALLMLPDLFIRVSLWLITHTLYRLRIQGLANVPPQGGALLVANHISFADAFLISAAVPRPVRHLMWRRFLGTRGFRRLTRLMRVIPVARTDSPRQLLLAARAARQAILDGNLVCLFAEGGLSMTGSVLGFRRGLVKIMRGIDAPVIPVAIDRVWGGITRFRGSQLSWRWPLLLPQPVTVIFGAPLPPTASAFRIRREVQELSAEAFALRKRPGESLPSKWIETARKRPFTFAMTDHTGRRLSFRKALAAGLALAGALEERLGSPRCVGILLPPSIGGALANLSLTLRGRIPVNLNYTLPPESAWRCARKARVATILTSREFLRKLGWDEVEGMVFLEEVGRSIPRRARLTAYFAAQLLPAFLLKRIYLRATDPDAPAAILFSSGTTGEPKGVMLSHFNILSNVQALDRVFDFTRSDGVVGVLPFFHAFGLTASVWLPQIVGFGALYHPNPLDARAVGRLVRENRATLLMAPPTFFQLYTKSCDGDDFSGLRYAVSGAEKLRAEDARAFEAKFGLPLLEGYGATELSPVAAVNAFDEGDERSGGVKSGSIGRPVPGVAVKVVDPQSGRELDCGEEGLLLIKGPNVMLGYLDEPELTARAVRDGWYSTGDIARLDQEGFIVITDRLSRFSKIGGEMVPHGKVEELLGEVLPGVGFAVTNLPSEKKGERLAVLHTPFPSEVTPAVVCERLRGRGAPNLWLPRPDSFVEVKELPMTGSGKIDLKAVKEIAQRAFVESRKSEVGRAS